MLYNKHHLYILTSLPPVSPNFSFLSIKPVSFLREKKSSAPLKNFHGYLLLEDEIWTSEHGIWCSFRPPSTLSFVNSFLQQVGLSAFQHQAHSESSITHFVSATATHLQLIFLHAFGHIFLLPVKTQHSAGETFTQEEQFRKIKIVHWSIFSIHK